MEINEFGETFTIQQGKPMTPEEIAAEVERVLDRLQEEGRPGLINNAVVVTEDGRVLSMRERLDEGARRGTDAISDKLPEFGRTFVQMTRRFYGIRNAKE